MLRIVIQDESPESDDITAIAKLGDWLHGFIPTREKYNSRHKPLLEKLKETWGRTPKW